jgi:putative endonuclease
MEHVVYILRSEADRNLMYIGMTNNMERRLKQHNGIISGGGEYTSENRPWKIVVLIPVASKSDALKIEYSLKAKNYINKSKIPEDVIQRRIYLIIESMKKYGFSEIKFFDSELEKCFHNTI